MGAENEQFPIGWDVLDYNIESEKVKKCIINYAAEQGGTEHKLFQTLLPSLCIILVLSMTVNGFFLFKRIHKAPRASRASRGVKKAKVVNLNRSSESYGALPRPSRRLSKQIDRFSAVSAVNTLAAPLIIGSSAKTPVLDVEK